MLGQRQTRTSPLDELTVLVTGARAAAAHLDGPSLDNCMRSLDSWFAEQKGALARDSKMRASASVALREIRDLCAVLAAAIRDGLSGAVATEEPPRYGRSTKAYDSNASSAMLTRRYG